MSSQSISWVACLILGFIQYLSALPKLCFVGIGKALILPHFPLSCQFKQLLTFLVGISTAKAVLWNEETT